MPIRKVSILQSIVTALFGGSKDPTNDEGDVQPGATRTLEQERERIRRDNPHGLYKGRHFTEYVDDVRRLKKADPLGAEALLLDLVAATEGEAKVQRLTPAPWYYEQVAILRRKRKDFAGEVAILEQHEQWHPRGGKFADRLRKARDLAARQG